MRGREPVKQQHECEGKSYVHRTEDRNGHGREGVPCRPTTENRGHQGTRGRNENQAQREGCKGGEAGPPRGEQNERGSDGRSERTKRRDILAPGQPVGLVCRPRGEPREWNRQKPPAQVAEAQYGGNPDARHSPPLA